MPDTLMQDTISVVRGQIVKTPSTQLKMHKTQRRVRGSNKGQCALSIPRDLLIELGSM